MKYPIPVEVAYVSVRNNTAIAVPSPSRKEVSIAGKHPGK